MRSVATHVRRSVVCRSVLSTPVSLAKGLDGSRYRLGQGPSWVAQRTMVSVLWYLSQARTQEMKWGVFFVNKVDLSPTE